MRNPLQAVLKTTSEAATELERQRQQEAARIRAASQAAIEKEKAKAKKKFEEEQVAKAEAEFEQQLAAKKAEAETAFRKQQQATARRYESRQVIARRIQARVGARKRGRLLRPSEEAAVKVDDTAYKTAMAATREQFKESLASWMTEQRAAFETEKKVAVKQFESQLTAWETTEVRKMEPQITAHMVAFKPRVKGVTEKILEWKPPDLPRMEIKLLDVPIDGGILRVGFDIGKFGEELMVGAVQAEAGFVASFESVAYSVGTIAGLKGLPAPPPTLTGALLTEGITGLGEATGLWTTKFEKGQLGRMDPRYAAGSILGDVLLTVVGGEVMKQAVRPAKAILGKAVAPVKTAWRGSRLDKFLYGHSKWYVERTGVLPKGYVGITKARLPPKVGLPTFGMEDIKLAEAARASFDITATTGMAGHIPYQLPFTGAKTVAPKVGITILKPWVKPTIPTVSIQAGKMLGITETAKRNITEFLKSTQAQVVAPRLVHAPQKIASVLPTLVQIPEMGIRAAAAYPHLGEILGFGTAVGVKAVPKAKAKLILDPAAAVAPVAAAITKISLKQVAVQKTKQITMQTPLLEYVMQTPTAPPSQLIPSFPMKPRRREEEEPRKRKRKKRRDLIGFRAGILEYELKGIGDLAKHILEK